MTGLDFFTYCSGTTPQNTSSSKNATTDPQKKPHSSLYIMITAIILVSWPTPAPVTLPPIVCWGGHPLTNSLQGAIAYISKAREPLVFTPKPILASSYELVNGRKLLLINIHAINFLHTCHFSEQLQQLAQLLQSHDGPAVIAGDFNSWHSSRLRAIEVLLARSSDSYREVDFHLHSQYIKRAPKFLQKLFGAHYLDRIYYQEFFLQVCESPLVLQQLGKLPLKISDHMPLYVQFRYCVRAST